MSRLKIKAVAFVLFILVLFFRTILKLNYIDDFAYKSMEKLSLNKTPFVLIVSVILSGFVILFFEKRFDFWTLFNFGWVFILFFIFNLYFIQERGYELVDYFFADKVQNFKIEKSTEDGWLNTQFVIDQDTLYYNQIKEWEGFYNGEYNLYKSRFQTYYYLKAAAQK